MGPKKINTKKGVATSGQHPIDGWDDFWSGESYEDRERTLIENCNITHLRRLCWRRGVKASNSRDVSAKNLTSWAWSFGDDYVRKHFRDGRNYGSEFPTSTEAVKSHPHVSVRNPHGIASREGMDDETLNPSSTARWNKKLKNQPATFSPVPPSPQPTQAVPPSAASAPSHPTKPSSQIKMADLPKIPKKPRDPPTAQPTGDGGKDVNSPPSSSLEEGEVDDREEGEIRASKKPKQSSKQFAQSKGSQQPTQGISSRTPEAPVKPQPKPAPKRKLSANDAQDSDGDKDQRAKKKAKHDKAETTSQGPPPKPTQRKRKHDTIVESNMSDGADKDQPGPKKSKSDQSKKPRQSPSSRPTQGSKGPQESAKKSKPPISLRKFAKLAQAEARQSRPAQPSQRVKSPPTATAQGQTQPAVGGSTTRSRSRDSSDAGQSDNGHPAKQDKPAKARTLQATDPVQTRSQSREADESHLAGTSDVEEYDEPDVSAVPEEPDGLFEEEDVESVEAVEEDADDGLSDAIAAAQRGQAEEVEAVEEDAVEDPDELDYETEDDENPSDTRALHELYRLPTRSFRDRYPGQPANTRRNPGKNWLPNWTRRKDPDQNGQDFFMRVSHLGREAGVDFGEPPKGTSHRQQIKDTLDRYGKEGFQKNIPAELKKRGLKITGAEHPSATHTMHLLEYELNGLMRRYGAGPLNYIHSITGQMIQNHHREDGGFFNQGSDFRRPVELRMGDRVKILPEGPRAPAVDKIFNLRQEVQDHSKKDEEEEGLDAGVDQNDYILDIPTGLLDPEDLIDLDDDDEEDEDEPHEGHPTTAGKTVPDDVPILSDEERERPRLGGKAMPSDPRHPLWMGKRLPAKTWAEECAEREQKRLREKQRKQAGEPTPESEEEQSSSASSDGTDTNSDSSMVTEPTHWSVKSNEIVENTNEHLIFRKDEPRDSTSYPLGKMYYYCDGPGNAVRYWEKKYHTQEEFERWGWRPDFRHEPHLYQIHKKCQVRELHLKIKAIKSMIRRLEAEKEAKTGEPVESVLGPKSPTPPHSCRSGLASGHIAEPRLSIDSSSTSEGEREIVRLRMWGEAAAALDTFSKSPSDTPAEPLFGALNSNAPEPKEGGDDREQPGDKQDGADGNETQPADKPEQSDEQPKQPGEQPEHPQEQRDPPADQ